MKRFSLPTFRICHLQAGLRYKFLFDPFSPRVQQTSFYVFFFFYFTNCLSILKATDCGCAGLRLGLGSGKRMRVTLNQVAM